MLEGCLGLEVTDFYILSFVGLAAPYTIYAIFYATSTGVLEDVTEKS